MSLRSSLAALVAVLAAVAVTAVAPSSVALAAPFVPDGPQPTSPDSTGVVNSTSTNWAGWDTVGGKYTTVSAVWHQPTVRCARGETSYSAFWVGLDGHGSSSVEQTGTAADCHNGTPQYYAWFEFYPKAPVNLGNAVRPGDVMAGKVAYAAGSGKYTLTITNRTRGWTRTSTGTAPQGRNASAEVIAEAPSSRTGVLPLANFGTVRFTTAVVNGRPLGAVSRPEKITMQQGSRVLATTTALTSNTAFTVTWKHA